MSLPSSLLRTLARPGPSRLPALARRSYAARAAAIPGTRPQFPVAGIQAGVPQFLDQDAMAAVERWQDSLWERLEVELKEHDDVRQQVGWTDGNELNMPALITLAARRPELGKAFNYASLIVNNHYFLAKLRTPSAPSVTPLRSFEDEVVGRARGMSGPGWLWLAKTSNGTPSVLATYGSGSILVKDGNYRGKSKPDLIWRPKPALSEEAPEASTQGAAPGGITAATGQSDASPEPVAVLSMFEATYADAYGTGPDARGRYAQDWYNSLDWRQIRSELA